MHGAVPADPRVSRIYGMFFAVVQNGQLSFQHVAELRVRLMRVLTLAMIAGTCVTTTGFVVAEFIPHLCVRLFTSDDTLTQMSVDGIRIMMAAMPIVGYQMIVTNFFQSIGKAKISIFLSLSRQLLFLLPLLAIMPHLMGVKGVWIAMPLSDTASALFAMIMMVRYMRMFKRQHKAMTANGDN